MNKTLFEHCLNASGEIHKFDYPADNILVAYFKKHPKLGTKDRQQIRDILFTLLRHRESIACFLGKQNKASHSLCCAIALLDQTQKLTGVATAEQITLAGDYLQWRQTLAEQVLSAQTELPQWLLDKLAFLSENDLRHFARNLSEVRSLDVRVNTIKGKRDKVLAQLQAESLNAQATPYAPHGIRFAEKTSLNKHPLFQNGSLEIQDEGSQLLAFLTGARRNELVVDFCAGAGGKSLAIGAMMANTGRIYAVDVSETRLRNIKPRLERSGLTNITLQQIAHERDSRLDKLLGKVDRVLVDAPCSGLGTLRRHPDLKYRQSPERIEAIKQTQQAILHAAAALLKEGGTLVYATCSILPEENEQQVDLFLQTHPEFTLSPVQTILEKGKIALKMDDYLNLNSAIHQTDGFFAAVMVKNNPTHN